MVHHVPIEKSKTVIFWLEHEDKYVNRLYKKNFQIPSVGQGGKGRRLFANFLDYFQKKSLLQRLFLEIVWKVSKQSEKM